MRGILMGAMTGIGRGMAGNAKMAAEEQSKVKMARELAEIEEQIRSDREKAISARRNQVLAQMPPGMGRLEQAEYLNRQGLSDDAKFAKDIFVADSQDRDRVERSRLTNEANDARAQNATTRLELERARLEAQQARTEAAGSAEGRLAQDLVTANVFPDTKSAHIAMREDSLIGEALRAVLANPMVMTMPPEQIAEQVRLTVQQLRSTGAPSNSEARGGNAGDDLPRPASQTEYNNLPSGTRFVAPDGSVRIKP